MIDFSGLTDQQLYEKCQHYGLNAKLWLRKFAGLLPEASRRGLYQKYRFYSIFDFASKLAGMGQETVKKILRIDEQLRDKPVLHEQFLNGKQGWSKFEVVAGIAKPETDQFWAEKVEKLPLASLQNFVRHYGSVDGEQNAMIEECRQVLVSMHLDPRLATRLYMIRRQIEKERKILVSWNLVIDVLLNGYHPETGKPERYQEVVHTCPDCQKKSVRTIKGDLEIQKEEVANELPLVSPRHMPTKVKRILELEYNNICAFPKCGKIVDVNHHLKRFSLVSNHDPRSIAPICKTHHSLMHFGLVGNEEKRPSLWYLRSEPDRSSPKFKIDKKFQIRQHQGSYSGTLL